MRMKRMIFRASRGRAIPTFFDLTIENKALKTKQEKKIFVILYQGGADDFLVQKILKICANFLLTKMGEVCYNGVSWRGDPSRHDNKKTGYPKIACPPIGAVVYAAME